ncbi:Protein kinase domain-containing protein [Raphanus sativus]|nr:Protein kinase domain-containing protein [Raphanus sativus]
MSSRSEFRFNVRPARERPCRRRDLLFYRKRRFLCFFFAISHRTPCLNFGVESLFYGGFVFGEKTLSCEDSWRKKNGPHDKLSIPGDGGYRRSIDAGFSSGGGCFLALPPPVRVPGLGKLTQLCLCRLLAPEDRDSHSSALSFWLWWLWRWSSCRYSGFAGHSG